MIQEEMEHLNREELISIILKQAKLIAALQKEIDALRMKLEKGQKPPTNSKNSSQPPSRDQKSGKLVNRPKRKHGPSKGHEKYERKFVAKPDHAVELKAERCGACHADLHEQAGKLVDVNQVVELPAAKAEVIELDFCTLKTEHSNRLASAFSGLLLPGIGNTQFVRDRLGRSRRYATGWNVANEWLRRRTYGAQKRCHHVL
jgi:hypothetical protein